jgi:alpha-tubulin suppressor-like RCC1 family protein
VGIFYIFSGEPRREGDNRMKSHDAANNTWRLTILLVILSLLLSAYQLPVPVRQEGEPTVEPTATALVEEPTLVPTELSSPSATVESTIEPTATATMASTEESSITPTEAETGEPTLVATETLTITPAIESTGTPTSTTEPLEAYAESENELKKIGLGMGDSCAIFNGDSVKCWGYNVDSRLGDGTYKTRLSPVDIPGLSSGVVSVSLGDSFACALTSVGGMKCWGMNFYGELGDGTTSFRSTPVDVANLSGTVTSIDLGYAHTCALMSGGAVKCWGMNFDGQLGDGTTTASKIPLNVTGLSSGIVAISGGSSHTCALTSGGAVKCWGRNNSGQLGDGTTTTRLTPVNVVGLSSGVIAISAGFNYNCAITNSGAAKCWGSNSSGMLGDGTYTTRLTPVTVSGLSSGVTSISTGYSHTCALIAGGEVRCWGNNYYGSLGDGTTTIHNTPVAVTDLSSGVSEISLGMDHTCAVVIGNGIKCWGRNNSGQLGNGTEEDSFIPVKVGYRISGQVYDMSNHTPSFGVTISDGSGHTTVSDSDGFFSFSSLDAGDYVFFATKAGYKFTPSSISVTINANNNNYLDFLEYPIIKYPVILLPGIMGTQLKNNEVCNNVPAGRVWLDLLKIGFLPILELKEDGKTQNNRCSIEIDGLLQEFGPFDFYKGFLSAIAQDYGPIISDYQGYDWRKDLEYNAEKLDEFIDSHKGNNAKVILIGHSMGGLLARQYISDPDRAENVAQVISIGSPYYGAPKLAYAMLSGQIGLPIDDYFINDNHIRQIIRNSPGSMELLPSRTYFQQSGGYLFTNMALKTTFEDTINYYKGNGQQNNALLDQADYFHNGGKSPLNDYQYLGIDNFSNLNGVQYTVLASNAHLTDSLISEIPCIQGINFRCQYPIQYLSGDGTVPWDSARLKGGTLDPNAQICTIKGASKKHGDLLNDTVVLGIIENVLLGNGLTSNDCEEAQYVSNQIEASYAKSGAIPSPFIQLLYRGNGSVSVLDATGNSVGPDSEGYIKNDIPFSSYDSISGGVSIVLPTDTTYTLTIHQNDTLPNQVWVTDFQSPGETESFDPAARAVFVDVPSTPDGVVTMSLNYANGLPSLQLVVSPGGGGSQEALPPTSVLNQEQTQDISMPVTTISISGARDSLGFFTGPVTATLSATDTGTGVLKTEYSLDGGTTWLLYSAPVNFTAEDVQMFHARSVDIAGNQEYPWPFEQIRPFNVSGKVTNPHGLPITEITVSDGNGHTAVVDSEGNYVLDGLRVGTLTVTPSMAGGGFTPASSPATVGPNGTGFDFALNAPLPVSTYLNPDMKYTGNPSFTIKVDGSGFVSTSIVRWNGTDRPTTFVNTSQLTAEIYATDIATAGLVNVTVFTPTPGGGTSNPQPFYITLLGKGPAIPVLSKPVANSILGNLIPMLTISSAARAVKYHFQVSTLDTFDKLIVNEVTSSKNYSMTPKMGLEWGKDYYWRVRSIDSAGARSGWSGIRKFTFNIQVSPPNNSSFTGRLIKTNGPSIGTNQITFRWSSLSPRLLHNIQVSTDADFTNLVIDKNIPTGNSFTTLLPKGNYYWRIRFKIGEEWSAFMPAWKFSVNIK